MLSIRGERPHRHRQHAQKCNEVWPCGFQIILADRESNRHTSTHHNYSHHIPSRDEETIQTRCVKRRYAFSAKSKRLIDMQTNEYKPFYSTEQSLCFISSHHQSTASTAALDVYYSYPCLNFCLSMCWLRPWALQISINRAKYCLMGQTHVGKANHVLDRDTYGRYLVNTTEWSVLTGNAGCNYIYFSNLFQKVHL